MELNEFMFLVGAMLDNVNPESTMPIRDLAAQRMREKILAKKRTR